MQFDDVEYLWKRLDDKVERSKAIEAELLRRVILAPVSRRVKWMTFWPAIDIPICIGGILLLVRFVGEQWSDTRVLVPAGVLVLSIFALLVDNILQISQMAGVDWSGPVAEIQASLERLRVAKIRQFKWVILLSPLLFCCGVIVAVEWASWSLTGDRLTILLKLEQRWVIGNVIFGFVFLLLGLLVVYVCSQMFRKHAWWQSMLDGIAGETLKRAKKEVELWKSLQHEGKE
jgi:hypothetical protein